MKLPLTGIIPPLITPLLNNDTIDDAGLQNLLEHIIKGGVHGVFILGTTGEATSLSYSLRKKLIAKTTDIVKKRIPVLVGVTDTSIWGTLEIANAAKQSGADAVVLSAPYYLPISQKEMVDYFEFIIHKIELPVMIYNMPSCTKLHMDIETIKKAKDFGAVGIKDSSGDWNYLVSLINEFKSSPEFSVMCGTEIQMPKAVVLGGHGAVAGGAIMFPDLFVKLFEASVKNDKNEISGLLEKVYLIKEKIYEVGNDSSKYIKGIKTIMSLMGVCNDFVAQPFCKYGDAERKILSQNLADFF